MNDRMGLLEMIVALNTVRRSFANWRVRHGILMEYNPIDMKMRESAQHLAERAFGEKVGRSLIADFMGGAFTVNDLKHRLVRAYGLSADKLERMN